MSPNGSNRTPGNAVVYRTEASTEILLRQLGAIRAIADGEKEALGFLPEAAYREAIEKGRLIAMCTPADGNIVGFILFSGVYGPWKVSG